MNRIATVVAAILFTLTSATAIAAPSEGYQGKVSDVAGQGLSSAYVCVKSSGPEVCALSDSAGTIELPATQGALRVEVVASTLGPVTMTLKRRARTTTVTCEKTFTSHMGQHAVAICSFDG